MKLAHLRKIALLFPSYKNDAWYSHDNRCFKRWDLGPTGGTSLTVQKADVRATKRWITAQLGTPYKEGEAKGRDGVTWTQVAVWNSEEGTDMAGASVGQGAQRIGQRSVEWPVPEGQGDACCCYLWEHVAMLVAVPLPTWLETLARCCSSRVSWNWKTKKVSFPSSPAFLSPFSASCWQSLPGCQLAREPECCNLQF